MAEQIAITIEPESETRCGSCSMLRGINVATCLARFRPEFHLRETLRPQECLDTARELAVMRHRFATGHLLP